MDEEYDVIVLGTGLKVKSIKFVVLALKNTLQHATFMSSLKCAENCLSHHHDHCLQLEAATLDSFQVHFISKSPRFKLLLYIMCT